MQNFINFVKKLNFVFKKLKHQMAKDIYHQIVRDALENDGWTITHDPYAIEFLL